MIRTAIIRITASDAGSVLHDNKLLACLCLALFFVAGCGEAQPPQRALVIKTPADPLTAADLELFLSVVSALPPGRIPEFNPPPNELPVDQGQSGEALVNQFRGRFRKLCDPVRQGAIWEKDAGWSKVLAQHNVAPAEFASLMGAVSCAVARVRVQAKVDIDHLVRKSRAEMEDHVNRMARIDKMPLAQVTEQLAFDRTESGIQLGKAVALLEFAEMVRSVPESNVVLTRKYSKQLKPLLAKSNMTAFFADLHDWDKPRTVHPAGFDTPNGHR